MDLVEPTRKARFVFYYMIAHSETLQNRFLSVEQFEG